MQLFIYGRDPHPQPNNSNGRVPHRLYGVGPTRVLYKVFLKVFGL